jgi:NTE family protein
MTDPSLREWLSEGPFGLAMSAGFFGFYAHAGAFVALEDAGLLPDRASGSSAGALVAGAWASGLDAAAFAGELAALRREHFWDPAPGFGLLRGRLFLERLRAMLPAQTFAACRIPLAVSAFDVYARRVRSLSAGDLPRAVVASCALPGLFHPVWIDGRPHVDGGVTDRAGLAGMPAGGRVLFHHLSSRSPWRRRGSPAISVPERGGLRAVVVEGVPRVGPFRLEVGPRAFEAARRGMQRALASRADSVIAA